MATIHQFAPVISPGDGVSGSVFLTRALLRKLGHKSEIYTGNTSNELRGETLHISKFDNNCDLLFVHHSMGHDLEGWLYSTACRRALIYHNITPSQYFHPDSNEYLYSLKGRQQLREWRSLFSGAVGVSPYNLIELEEAGYDNAAIIPLLIDFAKFTGETSPPNPSWHLRETETLVMSVGRFAENKRQHLLLEAFWYMRKMLPDKPARLILVGGVTSTNYHRQIVARIYELGLENEVSLTGKCSDAQLRWLYGNADVLWCASEHEGFCIPLVEANFFSLPVISFATSNIPETLGTSGILIEESSPIAMAATTVSILGDTVLSKKVVAEGARNLERYSADNLLPILKNYLKNYEIGS